MNPGGNQATRRDQVLKILAREREELRRRGVKALSLFGSLARNEATEASDVDLLVTFDKPVGLFAFVRLTRFLEELLGARVDLVTMEALRPELRERIIEEALRAG